jgi:hypothetical protein
VIPFCGDVDIDSGPDGGESHLTRRLFGAMGRRIAALPVPMGWTDAMGALKSGDQEVRVGEVCVECAGKTGFPRFGFFRQGEITAWASQRRLPEKRLHWGGSKVGGLGYTGQEFGIQNGNPG